MDAKYLAEIKARHEAATPGPWCAYGYHVKTEAGIIEDEICETERLCDADFILYARTDILALLAEVERLTEENHKQFATIGQQGREMNRRDEIIKQQDQQIDTLKKALEMANITIQKLSGENYEYSTSSFQAQRQEAEK